jgi:DNA mismatch repair protein MutS2
MDDKYLSTLEYDKIVDQLAQHTSFSLSRELAQELRPSNDEAEVRRRLQETTEAKALLSARTDVTLGGAHDVRALARRAALEAMLQPLELYDIRTSLMRARSLLRVIVASAD